MPFPGTTLKQTVSPLAMLRMARGGERSDAGVRSSVLAEWKVDLDLDPIGVEQVDLAQRPRLQGALPEGPAMLVQTSAPVRGSEPGEAAACSGSAEVAAGRASKRWTNQRSPGPK
jgi:hypothetical protein